MSKRWIGKGAVFGLVMAVGVTAASAQRDFSKVEIEAVPVAGNVTMLTGAGGNIGVSVGSDGILIVDDQFAPLAPKIKAALGRLGRGKVEFVLNTHWHGDHTGGNEVFGREAPIIAHANVRERLRTGMTVPGRERPPAPVEALPVVTFEDALSVHFNGEEIRVVHFPKSHTDGDSVVFFTGSNVVHMGDNFFSGMFPFVDIDSGGDVEGMARNVERILGMLAPDARVIPGHGPLSTVGDLRTYHRMLVESVELVRGKMRAGKGLDRIREEGMPGEWKDWAWSFISEDRWLETVHRSLSD